MSKKLMAISIFLALTAFVSGCIDNGTKPKETIKSEQIPTVNLPAGFTFMAVHETDVEIGSFLRKAIEGVYRTDTGEDIYIQVFKTEAPDALIDEYKASYKDAGYDPFTEVNFNDHKAIKVMYYITSNGKQIQKYNIIWAAKDSMIKVGSSTDAQKVINLATATNS